MARAKVVSKTYKTQVVQGKRGPKTKVVLDNKTITKATNQTKGAGVQRVLKSDKANLKAQAIQAKENIQKAKILGRSTDIATITSGLASTIQSGFGRIQPANTQQRDLSQVGKSDAGVAQAVNGGAMEASNSRNDDEDNPYVE